MVNFVLFFYLDLSAAISHCLLPVSLSLPITFLLIHLCCHYPLSSTPRPSTVSCQWWNRTLSRTRTSLTLVQVWESPGWVMPQFWLKWMGWTFWQIQFSARGPRRSSSWGPKGTEAPPALWNRFVLGFFSFLQWFLTITVFDPGFCFHTSVVSFPLLPTVAQDRCCRHQSLSLWSPGCWICGQP